MILDNFFAPQKKFTLSETSVLPRSPALAAPKAPRAPAAPTLEEEDQSVDPELVSQIYQNNQDIIGNNPNLIKPGQVLSLPDGSSYAVQRGDSLSKIAKKIQTPPMPTVAAPVSPVTVVPAVAPPSTNQSKPTGSSVFDVFPDIGGKIYDLTHPSAIPNSPAVAGHPAGTVVRPDWSQTKYRDLGPLTKGPDGVWHAQNGASAVDPAVIAMAEKLSPVQKAKAVAAQPAKASPAPVTAPATKASPEMVPAADSMAPGEEIVTAKKPKPPVVLPKRVGTPTPKTGIAAAADKAGDVVTKTVQGAKKLEKSAEKTAGQAYDWLASLVRKRESGDNYDIGHHYAAGSGTAGPDNRKTTAWGAYGLTAAAILDARREDATLQKSLKEWTPEDQTRAFNIVNNKYLTRMNQLGVDLGKHPEAPSIAILLGPDGAAKYYNTGKFNQAALDNNGGEDGVKAIIAQRTKDALTAIEKQKKQKVKETIGTVNAMLETAGTADDIRHIRNYIDRQYIRYSMLDEVAFAQRNHLVERVIEITNQRRLLAR